MSRIVELMTEQRDYKGVGFIKSYKSGAEIMHMTEKMIAEATKINLILLEIIVDQSIGINNDEEKIAILYHWMEKDYVNAIVVRSIFEISNNIEDLIEFMRKAEGLNVAIYSMENGMNLAYIPWNGEH